MFQTLLQRLACLVTACLLVACAATPPRTVADDQAFGSVAVVSLLNEETRVSRIGLTVFNNKSVVVDQTDVLNKVAVDALESTVRKARPAWTVKDARSEIPALMAAGKAAGASWTSATSALTPHLAATAQRLGVDAMFVVVDRQLEHVPGRGVGMIARTMKLTSLSNVTVHSVLLVVLVDKNGNELNLRGGDTHNVVMASQIGLDYDLALLDTPEGMDRMRQLMQEQLRTAVTSAAANLGY